MSWEKEIRFLKSLYLAQPTSNTTLICIRNPFSLKLTIIPAIAFVVVFFLELYAIRVRIANQNNSPSVASLQAWMIYSGLRLQTVRTWQAICIQDNSLCYTELRTVSQELNYFAIKSQICISLKFQISLLTRNLISRK